MALRISSPAFGNGAVIPDQYTKEYGNVSPPLEWSGAPKGTRSFALVMEDPDAPSGIFRHWAIYDIPADRSGLGEGADLLSFGRGINDFGNRDYDGPRPPKGHGTHRYIFRLAALNTDQLAGVSSDTTAAEVRDQMQRHQIEEAELVGTYEVK